MKEAVLTEKLHASTATEKRISSELEQASRPQMLRFTHTTAAGQPAITATA